MIELPDSWNTFIDKTIDNIYNFDNIDDTQKDAAILLELHFQSASGDGWEYFFDHITNENISYDVTQYIIEKYFNNSFVENYLDAKILYINEGFDGDYDEVNKPFTSKETEELIQKTCLDFINNHKDLYE